MEGAQPPDATDRLPASLAGTLAAALWSLIGSVRTTRKPFARKYETKYEVSASHLGFRVQRHVVTKDVILLNHTC
jgi:hypothetical protein